MSESFTIQIDGNEIECKPGDKVLQVALDNGIHIPHYCYHPGLSIAGNCRMCLCNSNKAPKPVISCATDCVPGLEIDTTSDEVKAMQEAVMEFLLINHPLDCPVCDQAGECRLQDYAHEYGRDKGRFLEAKNVKPDTVVGPEVALWKQRCIACSRCIRFCDEVSGTGELRFMQRGDRVEIDIFPGEPLDNPMSGNVVDICPVGALVSRDFLFEARVWNLTRQPSVCPGCSRGCNVYVDVLDTKWEDPEVKRIVPRENPEVNEWWMCDFGRAEGKDVTHAESAEGEVLRRLAGASKRVLAELDGEPDGEPEGELEGATGEGDAEAANAEAAKAEADEAAPELVTLEASFDEVTEAFVGASERHRGKVAVIGNLWQTVEELHLVAKLAGALDAPVSLLERPTGQRSTFPGFEISADKNPNREGALMVFGKDQTGLEDFQNAVKKGEIKAAIVFDGMPGYEASREFLEALDSLEDLFVVALFGGDIASRAGWVLPGVSWAEKDGVYVNEGGRAQRLTRSMNSPGNAAADMEHLQRLCRAMGAFDHDEISSAGVFQLASKDHGALSGVTYPSRGSMGQKLNGVGGAK